ncbi:hypothetical protein TNCV_2590571 [Trichonephila clavipes]|nr:hypothetical protein TNCV_2590571 [Trichonephila clavipes]
MSSLIVKGFSKVDNEKELSTRRDIHCPVQKRQREKTQREIRHPTEKLEGCVRCTETTRNPIRLQSCKCRWCNLRCKDVE